MIRSHQSSMLRRLLSISKDNKNCQRYKVFNKTTIFSPPCFTNEKHRQHCACKRRRKDIDKAAVAAAEAAIKLSRVHSSKDK